MSYDPTVVQPQGRCKTCRRELAPRQNYCREHKCLQTKEYGYHLRLNLGGITLVCQKEVEHTGRCLFIFLGEVIETGLRK